MPAKGVPAGLLQQLPDNDAGSAPFGESIRGGLSRTVSLAPGAETTVTFLLAWHFPNDRVDGVPDTGRYYAKQYADASAVVDYVAGKFASLQEQTRRWRDTWYASTLPYWFLDRTMLNTSILATSTCHRFANGRFYGWEGVGCCQGTCTHVWQYAQAVARLFPALERDLRERTDFGLAFEAATGIIRFRGEVASLAIDGQSGCILRSYREHQMSADDKFLKRNWPKIKRAVECLIDKDQKDGEGNGVLTSNQHNTLDTDWFGPVAWLSGMYLAALRAAEQMATEVGDKPFAATCQEIRERGQKYLVEKLVQRRVLHQQGRSRSPGYDQLGYWLRDRSGLGSVLVVASRTGTHVAPVGDCHGAQITVALQFHAGRRSLSRSAQAGPLVRDAW